MHDVRWFLSPWLVAGHIGRHPSLISVFMGPFELQSSETPIGLFCRAYHASFGLGSSMRDVKLIWAKLAQYTGFGLPRSTWLCNGQLIMQGTVKGRLPKLYEWGAYQSPVFEVNSKDYYTSSNVILYDFAFPKYSSFCTSIGSIYVVLQLIFQGVLVFRSSCLPILRK